MDGNVSNLFVIALGMGTVFVGLICIILLCKLMSFCVGKMTSGSVSEQAETSVAANNEPIANRQEIIAAACAVIAEETGSDVNNMRVVSFKKM